MNNHLTQVITMIAG